MIGGKGLDEVADWFEGLEAVKVGLGAIFCACFFVLIILNLE